MYLHIRKLKYEVELKRLLNPPLTLCSCSSDQCYGSSVFPLQNSDWNLILNATELKGVALGSDWVIRAEPSRMGLGGFKKGFHGWCSPFFGLVVFWPLNPFYHERTQCSSYLEDSGGKHHFGNGEQSSADIHLASTLILNYPASRTVRNIFCL